MHENCKTPQLSDDELVRYLVKRANEDANLTPSVLGVVTARKRGPSQVNNATASSKAVVKKPSAKSGGVKKKIKNNEVVVVSDEEVDTISKNKEISKSIFPPPVNDLLLEVQRRLKELDEREIRLAEKEKESAVCVASTAAAAAALSFKNVPATAKYQSTPAESLFPMHASSIVPFLPTQTASSSLSGSSAAAIMTLLYEQQTDERVNRLRDESESLRFKIMMRLLQSNQ